MANSLQVFQKGKESTPRANRKASLIDQRLKGLSLAWRTPDGRELCFAWNGGDCAMALAAGSINAVSKVAMVPTKQLAIARIRGRDISEECGPSQQSHTELRLRKPILKSGLPFCWEENGILMLRHS